jgi:hypothetical protein
VDATEVCAEANVPDEHGICSVAVAPVFLVDLSSASYNTDEKQKQL